VLAGQASGGGYLIDQMILEDVLGVLFAELTRNDIFEPLGMTRTSFESPWPEHLRDDAAAGHGDDVVAHPPGSLISAEPGAGGLHSTTPDYARFGPDGRVAVLEVFENDTCILAAERI
jgi:CubicO group peptidase (beta-lactamase class C family)